jgi:hypothetical protein
MGELAEADTLLHSIRYVGKDDPNLESGFGREGSKPGNPVMHPAVVSRTISEEL